MKISLYTTHCPYCEKLKIILSAKKIGYKEVEVTPDELIEMGYSSAPILMVGNEGLTYVEAIKWIQSGGNKDEK